jgi:hypothetical protein
MTYVADHYGVTGKGMETDVFCLHTVYYLHKDSIGRKVFRHYNAVKMTARQM